MLLNNYITDNNILYNNVMLLDNFNEFTISEDILDNYTFVEYNKENIIKILNTKDKYNLIFIDDIDNNIIRLYDINHEIYGWIDLLNILMSM